MLCKHCGYHHLRFLTSMKNVDKYICPKCHGTNIFAKPAPFKPAPIRGKVYVVFNHQGKADAYINALKTGSSYSAVEISRGLHPGLQQYNKARFVLTDTDVLHRVKKLERIRKFGTGRFFIYSHAARPNLFNDIYPCYEYTTAQFVASEGHIEILKRFDYPKPLHAVGWHLTPILPFRSNANPKNVLFAPIHPRNAEIDRRVNAAAFSKLVKLALDDGINLTVRYISSLELSGIIPVEHKNISYVQGDLVQNGHREIPEDTHLVVGHQTFAWKSVALGYPVLMMGEEENPTHVMTNPIRFVNSWEKYKDLLCFPEQLDILCHDDTMELIKYATASEKGVKLWKEKMIGKPFNPEIFVSTLESYL